jgi:TonB-linked SusC/RagA family outer membrane protein
MPKGMKNMRTLLLMIFAALSLSVSAQTITLNGNVKDTTGEPIIGASIVEKGNTTNGTITDLDGNFSLKVPANATVVISYIGMKTQEIAIKGKSKIDVTLSDDAKALDEVVVIGYGTAKRKDITGSVATVNAEALTVVPVASATEALTGKMAGVQITTTEGSPDAEMKIRVRGGGSITGDNTPLFIVDGFPVESISDIPASDIEDMTVLKDASSTAIYGSRGANGVILVTTKSGKEGKISVNYNAYYSWKKMAKQLNTLSSGDYAKWQYELAMLNSGKHDTINPDDYTKVFGNYQDIDLYENIEGNNWQDQVFGRTGHTFNHNLSINGGSDKTKFAFSYAHMDDKAIMQDSDFKRDNLSLKVNHKPNKRVALDFSVRYSNTTINGAGANESKSEVSSADSRMKDVMIYTPFNFKDLSDGYDPDLQLTNPLVSVADNARQQSRQTFNYNGSFTWEFIDNLKFKTEFGLDHYYNKDKRFYGVTTYNSRINGNNQPIAVFTSKERKTFRNTNTLNYDFKKILKNKDHSLSLLVGQELIKVKSNTDTDEVRFYPKLFTADQAFNLSSQGTAFSTDKFYNADDILLSYFARANYDFQGKYLASATFRADGSSKFSKDNRWGFFPSAALAWRMSSENFMESTKSWLDDLKLRISYGTAGNNIPSDQTSTIWSAGSGASIGWMNNMSSYWTTGAQMANPDLKWETTHTRNAGLDFTLLNGKLSGTVEYYWNTTKDLLINFPVSGVGYSFQYRNLGETENKGWEVTLNWNAINKKNYALSFNANVGFNKNKVKSLGSLMDYSADSGWASTDIQSDFKVQPGHSVGEIYGFVSDGRYEVSDFEGFIDGKWVLKAGVADASDIIGEKYLRPGAMKLKNVDGSEDNKVTKDDQKVIGDTNPFCSGGFSVNARVYGFDLTANFTYSIGNDIYNANKIEYTSSSKYKYRNMIDVMAEEKRWTNLNADGTICNDPTQLAAMNANTSMWSPWTQKYVLTDWAVEDGSFLRLATLSIGYTLPQTLTRKVGIQNLRFYATGYNLFCITNYSGFDPEVSTRTKSALTPGVDYSAYPKSRQYVIGLNLTF